MRRITCVFACGLIGLFLLMMGLGLFWYGARSLIRMWAWESLTLKNGSEAMSRWSHPPEPLILKVYIFNVTNPQEVSEGARPVFSEVGPYVYEETREKLNITYLKNFTLSYRLKNEIKFKRRRSGGLRQSDKVTILNVPLAGAILSVYEAVPEFVGLLDDLWRFFFPGEKSILITRTVKEILFDGITIDCSSKITEVYLACRALETRNTYSVRKEGKNFKFSFLYAKNGTSPETYLVNQGVLDLKKSAQFVGMDNSSTVNKWRNQYCDMINGSDGAQFPIKLDKTQKLYIFEKELCRSVFIEFEEEVYKNGVYLYKYSTTTSLFASPEENPDNACFCRYPFVLKDLVQEAEFDATEEEDRICFANGILPLLPCVGAPIVASLPHFYLGDQNYVNFSGLQPIKELHENVAYVEPNSGIVVAAYKRFQFNMEVKKISDVQITSKLADGLFPILWMEEEMELSSDLFKLLRYTLIQKEILEVGTFVLIGGGLFLIVCAYIAQYMMDRSMCCSNGKFLKKVDCQKVTQNEKNLFSKKIGSENNSWPQNIQNKKEKKQAKGGHSQGHSLIDNFM